ncbi:hypothetical protein [Micromonospora sp. CPCC 206061]|uniref:hypothetical protein n=1 Tax=Micromonospora sp. CPCC 206061 TaxID=3122410 RepID=UPI002FF09D8F
MAVRGWRGSVATAIGSAAGAAAAQLGLGYGLGIIAWLPATDAAGEAAWVASLAWAAWIAATSTVIGVICADRLGSSAPERSAVDTPLATALWRVALAVAAAVGGLVTVALVAVPAREAVRADTFSPQTIAAGYAVIGVILGLLVAVWAVATRAVAANVLATASWLWLLAIVAVIDGVATGDGLAAAQLGVWQMTSDDSTYWVRNIYLPGAGLSLGSALVIGTLAAWPAARRGDGRVGTAVSGGIGPLLVAAAYILAAPKLVGVRAEQLSAHLIAPYAVIAGLAGSVLMTAIWQRVHREPTATELAALEWPADKRAGTQPADTKPADANPADTKTADPKPEPALVPAQTPRVDLADDAYAPARAYVSDTAPPDAAVEPARGQAAVKAPVWPEPAAPAAATEEQPKPKGRQRRGKTAQ